MVSSPNLADFRFNQRPRFLADGSAPIAVKIGVPQPFAKTLCVNRVDQHAMLAKHMFQIRIGGAHEGTLLGK